MGSKIRRLAMAPVVLALVLGIAPAASAGKNPLGTVDATPKSINFGKVAVGTQSPRISFWITNNTKATLFISQISSSTGTGDDQFGYWIHETTNPCWELAVNGTFLAPGQSCGGSVEFHPTMRGKSSSSIHFAFSDGVRSWSLTETLSGTGV